MTNILKTINSKENLYHLTGATSDEISLAEKDLQLVFHKDYKEYVSNFGFISYGSHELTGICSFPRLNVVNVTQEERKYNPSIPQQYYVIEQTNIEGIVVWQSPEGNVYQSTPDHPLKQIATSLSEYIEYFD